MNKNWLFYTGLVIEAAIFVLIFSGCMKEPDFKQDFGAEVSSQTINESLKDIAANLAPAESIKPQEVSYRETWQQIENLSPLLVYQERDDIISVATKPTVIELVITRKIRELIDGKMVESEKDYNVSIGRSATPLPNLNELVHSHFKQSLTSQATAKPSDQKVTYHNFNRQEGAIAVPELVKRREDCGGLGASMCAVPLPVSIVTFDQVIWKDGAGEKYEVRWVFSPRVPYFSSQLSDCVAVVRPYQGQLIRIQQCSDVKDFTFGKDPAIN